MKILKDIEKDKIGFIRKIPIDKNKKDKKEFTNKIYGHAILGKTLCPTNNRSVYVEADESEAFSLYDLFR